MENSKKREITITKATVYRPRSGGDHCWLKVVGSPSMPSVANEPPILETQVNRGDGVKWLCDNFNLVPSDIDVIEELKETG